MPNNATITTNQPRIPFAAHAIALTMFIALSFPTGATHAQDAPGVSKAGANGTRASYAACLAEAAGVTPDMKQCMGTEYAYQDKRLNKAYKALMATLDKGQQAKLRSNEHTWITYRDSHCALDPNGGQAAELDAYDCSVGETAKQANALEKRLHKAH
ncbi:MAG TPA: lysozyme inhibitor LprI family protein [Rhodanobacter sp.]